METFVVCSGSEMPFFKSRKVKADMMKGFDQQAQMIALSKSQAG